MYRLYVGNKNYSSWSLRAWVLMRELNIEFAEQLLRFGDVPSWESYRKIAPSGKVPCLIDDDVTVWDTLAIAEYLAERHAGVWPSNPTARAWGRSAAAEMHSGFSELRNRCSMSCGVRMRLKEFPAVLKRDLARICELWNDGLHRFGGPFLAGAAFTAVDAFFAPVAFRVQTYGLPLDETAAAYVSRLLELRSMRQWYADALREKFRDQPHDDEVLAMASVVDDFRES
jgi:glutathione S-transferase